MSLETKVEDEGIELEKEINSEDQLLDEIEKKTTKKGAKTKAEKLVEDPNDLNGMEGIGPERTKKLNAVGIYSVSDLAIANATELYNILSGEGSVKNVSMNTCIDYIVKANNHLVEREVFKQPLMSSKDLLIRSKTVTRFSCGDETLDKEFFGGGIESRAVTEFYGAYGSGKTQMCYSTVAIAAGQGKKVLFIDTEDTYQPERIDEIALEKGFDSDTVHGNIQVLKPQQVSMFMKYLENLFLYVRQENIKLIIIDSIIALHKAEFFGRGQLAPRQQSLTGIMQKLKKIAEVYDVGVMITNHIIANPDPYKPGTEVPAGGNSIAHFSTHRIALKTKIIQRTNEKYSVMTMDDSPRYPRMQIPFKVKIGGVCYKDITKAKKDDEEVE